MLTLISLHGGSKMKVALELPCFAKCVKFAPAVWRVACSTGSSSIHWPATSHQLSRGFKVIGMNSGTRSKLTCTFSSANFISAAVGTRKFFSTDRMSKSALRNWSKEVGFVKIQVSGVLPLSRMKSLSWMVGEPLMVSFH